MTSPLPFNPQAHNGLAPLYQSAELLAAKQAAWVLLSGEAAARSSRFWLGTRVNRLSHLTQESHFDQLLSLCDLLREFHPEEQDRIIAEHFTRLRQARSGLSPTLLSTLEINL